MKKNTLHWQWVTYQNFKQLGYTEDELGCITIEMFYANGETKKCLLSHDDEFDDFFAVYNISPLVQEGVLEVNDLSQLLEYAKTIWPIV